MSHVILSLEHFCESFLRTSIEINISEQDEKILLETAEEYDNACEIQNAQQQRVASSSKHGGQRKEKPNKRKREREGTSNERTTSNGKRARLNDNRELASLTAKINSSEESMVKVKARIKKTLVESH